MQTSTSKSKSKRMTKALVGVMTTGLLATHFVQPASAQTASKVIPVSINISGTVPALVTSATVTLSCKNTTSTSNYQGEKATSVTLAANQVNLNNFALESVPAGALCKFAVSGIGPTPATGSTPLGTVTLILGGAPVTDSTRYISGPTPGVSSDFIALPDNSTAVINLTFPAVATGGTTTTAAGSSTIPGQTTIPAQSTTTIRGGIIFPPIEIATSTVPSTTSAPTLATTSTALAASSSSTSTVPPTTLPSTTVATLLPVVTTAPVPVTIAPVMEPDPPVTKPSRAKRTSTTKRKATLAAKKTSKKKSSKSQPTKTAQR